MSDDPVVPLAHDYKAELRQVPLASIIFDEVIYPRLAHDPALVQRYVDVLDEIEAKHNFISLSADLKILDGKHRWLAYRTKHNGAEVDIPALVYAQVTEPHDQLRIAAQLNSSHGAQMSEADKEATAKALYAFGNSYELIAATLSVGKAKVSAWLARTVKDAKEKRDRRIFDLWLSCHTQEEIAADVETERSTVEGIIGKFDETVLGNQTVKAAASHLVDFEPPIYNIWRQQEKTGGKDAIAHFGNSEVRWVDNLLYLYTAPFDVVVDPFAGSGSTIDICRKRFRRYWVGDRAPIVSRETEIRKHDITAGLPPLHRWKDVRLVYLDPPYWKQAEGEYSDAATDLANMPLEKFNAALAGLINGIAKKLSSRAVIALLIQPTQWKAPERKFTDHMADMLRKVRLPVDMRFSTPYETQQPNAQMVDWAKAEKRCLVLTRELVVWRVP